MVIGASCSPGGTFVRSWCRSDNSSLSLEEIDVRGAPRTLESHGYLE
jgi:hypothetical protein